jgi:D-alanyl-lipoteichoic acid acyltransferase DltB (MBOAT superfamily)
VPLIAAVADFWNCRWNLTVSNVLRSCVYDPVMDGK